MTRSRDVADTQDNQGGAVAPYVGAKNLVINGGMDFWQRGTSIAGVTAVNYTADRWMGFRANTTFSRQSTNDTTNLANIQYCMRVQRNSGISATDVIILTEGFETVNSIPFAGKSVTLSYYARKGANYSATGNSLGAYIFTGTGTDQNILVGYTGAAIPVNASGTLTDTWQRFSATGTIATSATELSVRFEFNPTGTAGANDYFEITGVQVEIGNVATPFARAGGSIGAELALCQRYYWRAGGDSAYQPYAVGTAQSTTTAQFSVQNPVPMRIAPASIDFSTVAVTDSINAYSISSISFSNVGKYASTINVATSSLTIFRPYIFVSNNSTSGYFGLSAEL